MFAGTKVFEVDEIIPLKPLDECACIQCLHLCSRFFNEFLMTHERMVAKEVRDEYVDTMSKMYYSYFKSYNSRLMKLQVGYISALLYLCKLQNLVGKYH